jgi:hypothetical protein
MAHREPCGVMTTDLKETDYLKSTSGMTQVFMKGYSSQGPRIKDQSL